MFLIRESTVRDLFSVLQPPSIYMNGNGARFSLFFIVVGGGGGVI